MRRLAFPVVLLLALPGLASAAALAAVPAAPAARPPAQSSTLPPRPPLARQMVIDLAYVMGEAHALRQACLGEGDQSWRVHMSRLLEVEGTDPALGAAGQRRLVESFNAGFSARRAQFPNCGPQVRETLEETAAKGELLARRLGGAAAEP